MHPPFARFRALYGAHPLHLLAVLASFAVLGYVVYVMGPSTLWNPKVWWKSILVWFVGAVVLHDLILFPLYALADRAHTAGTHALRRRLGHQPEHPPRVSTVNYVRVPVLASGLLFLLFFPGIIAQGATTHLRATGQTQAPFLGRWLLLTAIIFTISALTYATHRALAHRREIAPSSAADGSAKSAVPQEPNA